MKNKNKIQETMFGDADTSNKTTVNIKKQDLSSVTNDLKKLGKDVNVNIVDEELNQPEAVIEPQDQETIKYLSNVIDNKTGKVSQPFTIADKNYQMVRGMKPNKEVVLSVMCLDDSKIYEVEQFEKEIALPMKEMLEKQNQQNVSEDDTNEIKEMSLSEYKHYVVNEKKNSFKKFKSIHELVKNGLTEDEKYMNLKEFKKYYESKVFGKKQIGESGMLPDVTKVFANLGQKMGQFLNKVDTPREKIQLILQLVDKFGFDKNLTPKLVNLIKKQSENKFTDNLSTPNDQSNSQQALTYESKERKVIKVINKKNIKDE